jgi:SAM-dependent methyltransferase
VLIKDLPPKIAKEEFMAFNLNAANYLEDDIHWGDDTDLIYLCGKKLAITLGRKIDIIYPGVGPGRIFTNLFFYKKFFRSIYAFDYSPKMIELCQGNLKVLDNNDIKDIDIRVEERNIFNTNGVKNLTYDMALLLNNTLGNVINNDSPQESRAEAISILAGLLKTKGGLFLSIYDVERFKRQNSFYTPQLKIIETIGKHDFVLELIISNKKHLFYSHWFSESEIRNLLIKFGLTIKNIWKRRERIIVYSIKGGCR